MQDREYYIRQNGELVSVTADEFHKYIADERRKRNVYTIKVWHHILEVEERDYKLHYQILNRKKYLLEQAELYEEFSFNYLDTDDMLGEDTIEDVTIHVEETAINRTLIEKIRECLPYLEYGERVLLKKIFCDEISERELARDYGVSQPAIHKKKQRILQKLKK